MTTSTSLKTATRDGVALRYLDTGAGEPALLLIHGWTCDHTNWKDQIAHFSPRHRIVAMDLRGHGASDKPEQGYSIDGFVDDVAWLIRELGLDKPVVIGHSMGGVIALNLVRKHPGLAAGIVMVDSPVFLPEATKGLLAPLFAGLESPEYASVFDSAARSLFFGPASPPALVDEIVASSVKTPQNVMVTAIVSTLSEASRTPGPILVPALYLRATDPAIADEADIRKSFPGLGLVNVPCAHFVQMEQPAATNNIIRDFLDKLE